MKRPLFEKRNLRKRSNVTVRRNANASLLIRFADKAVASLEAF